MLLTGQPGQKPLVTGAWGLCFSTLQRDKNGWRKTLGANKIPQSIVVWERFSVLCSRLRWFDISASPRVAIALDEVTWLHLQFGKDTVAGLEVSQNRRQETCQEPNAVIQVKVLNAGIKAEAAHTEQGSLTFGDYWRKERKSRTTTRFWPVGDTAGAEPGPSDSKPTVVSPVVVWTWVSLRSLGPSVLILTISGQKFPRSIGWFKDLYFYSFSISDFNVVSSSVPFNIIYTNILQIPSCLYI